jgi:hypothetical protein
LRLQQRAVGAVHANAIVLLEEPAAWALLRKSRAEETELEEEAGGFHCVV